MTVKDDHLSVQQVNSLNRCEYAFLRHYGYGETEPPKFPFQYGRAFEAGIDADYSQKIESHENMPTEDVVEMNVEAFRDIQRDEGATQGPDNGDALDQMAKHTSAFHQTICHAVQPTAVQLTLSMSFENTPWTFTGRLDLLAGGTIIDNKTSGKPAWAQATLAEQLQPAAYDLLTRYSPDSPLRGRGDGDTQFQFHVSHHTVNGKWRKTPVAEAYPVTVTQAQRDGFLNILSAANQRKTRILESGAAMPHYGWQCKGCGFRDACAFEFGREPPK